MKSALRFSLFGIIFTMIIGSAFPAFAVTVYQDGVSPQLSGVYVVGDHLVGGAHPSVNGIGGSSGISDAGGDTLNGQRTYIWDKGAGAAAALAIGTTSRGDSNFAMLIFDMGSQFNSMRLFTHQDHILDGINDGPLNIFTDFVAQDVMEYSVWGSNDGDNFVLLSDVTAFDIDGGGVGKPTYTFSGTEPTVVYRGGSFEFPNIPPAINAYTRDYTFNQAFQYYGIRTSTISLVADDADPEIDAVVGFNAVPPSQVVGGSLLPISMTSLLVAGVQSVTWMIPVVFSLAGIVMFVVSRRPENY